MVNTKALLAAATAGLVVVGVVHWFNGREGDTTPRVGLHHRRRRGVSREVRFDGRCREALQRL